MIKVASIGNQAQYMAMDNQTSLHKVPISVRSETRYLFAHKKTFYFRIRMFYSEDFSTMDHLRLVGECYPSSVGYFQTDNGTIWQGQWFRFFSENQHLFPTYQILTESEFVPANQTYTTLQTLYEGKADVIPDQFGITQERYQFVDFSQPVSFPKSYVITAKNLKVGASFFTGVFDLWSLASFFLSLTVLWGLYLFIYQQFSDNRLTAEHVTAVLTYGLGSLFAQPLPLATTGVFKCTCFPMT